MTVGNSWMRYLALAQVSLTALALCQWRPAVSQRMPGICGHRQINPNAPNHRVRSRKL